MKKGKGRKRASGEQVVGEQESREGSFEPSAVLRIRSGRVFLKCTDGLFGVF